MTQSVEDVVSLISKAVDDSGLDWLAPSRAGDADFDRRLLRLQRNSVRQGAMGHYYRQTLTSDIGDTIPAITCPTLVMNRSGNRIVPIEHSRDVAAGITGAKLVELPGEDHLIFSQDIDRIADEIEEFLTGRPDGRGSGPDAHHAAVHRHRGLHEAGRGVG